MSKPLNVIRVPQDGNVHAVVTGRYALALGLVACLSLAAWLALQFTIAAQEQWAAVVNVSGRQRMLSQRTTLFAKRLVLAEQGQSAVSSEELRRTLASDIALMERSHRGLLEGDPDLGLPGEPSERVRDLYFGSGGLDALVRNHLERLREILGGNATDLDPLVADATGPLLTTLDQVVRTYQAEAEEDIAGLRTLETVVLALTLSALVLEAVLIFRPLARRLADERQRLQAAEIFTRSVLDNSHDAICTVVDGRIESANPASQRIWGVVPQALVGRAWMDCFLDPTVASVQCDKATPVAEGIKTLVATPGDRTVDAAFRLVDGRYVVCIRESTAQLVRYAARLKERNVELDRFASVVAHDLRAPLRAIGNLAEFIGEDLGDDLPEESAEHLDLLQRRVHRLDLLVDGLHQYAVAGRRGQELVQVSVDELAKEIVDEQRGDRVVTLDLAGDFPICLTEQGRLWQVLANLIGNAIRHHPRPAVLIRLTGWVDEDRLHLSVEDDGAGIDVAQRERVFQIFHSMAVAENSGGLGLGLALVKRIVAERSGTVRIEGSDLGGAAVHFDWPIREEQG